MRKKRLFLLSLLIPLILAIFLAVKFIPIPHPVAPQGTETPQEPPESRSEDLSKDDPKTVPEPSEGLPVPIVEESGEKPEELLEPVTPVPLNEVRYTTSDLNLRVGPGKDYEVTAVLRKGAMITVMNDLENGWTFVGDGYVSSRYLTTEVPAVIPEGTTYSPMTIYLRGFAIPYVNGGVEKGQQIIDDTPSSASTWGGANPWSGEDGQNTHFIAHDYGAFKDIWEMKAGDIVIVTNNKGVPTHYALEEKFLVDRYGVRVDDGAEMFGYITGLEGGEVLTLQTCQPGTVNNWILRATKTY